LESHHFYPILKYFRFAEPQYALARVILILMDTASLAKTAINSEKYSWLIQSAALAELSASSSSLVTHLARSFLPGGYVERIAEEEETQHAKWRAHYIGAVEKLYRSGIDVPRNVEDGAKAYISLRGQWNAYVIAFTRFMQYDEEMILPPLFR
jgi:hypothetical protein